MSLALYMDEHVPLAITAGLRRRGVEGLSVQEDGYSARPDPDTLDGATALGHLRILAMSEDTWLPGL